MNKNILFWGDLHIGHQNAYKFASKDGDRKMRSFDTMEDCELLMVENYNKIVKDDDIVYFLGDIILDKKRSDVLSLMKKGAKHLILGNHDNKGDVVYYRNYFDKVYGVLYLPKLKSILSHIPIHSSFLGPQDYLNNDVRFEYSIHGHCHDNHIMLPNSRIKDQKYLNTCVEVVDYKPVTFEELKEINRVC